MTHVYLYVDELQYELEGSMFHGSGMGVLRAFAQSPILTASMIPESFICIYYLERRTRDSRVIKYFNNNEIFHPILAVLYVGHVLIQMDSSPLNFTIFIDDDGPFWVFWRTFSRRCASLFKPKFCMQRIPTYSDQMCFNPFKRE